MLLEWFTYLTTSCPTPVAKLGYLQEMIGAQSRYRRCKKAWQPHLVNTQEAIMEAAKQCKQQRTAVILGSGYWYDIPVEMLSRIFKNVLLVDIFHMPAMRGKAERYPNVQLITEDITGEVRGLSNYSFGMEPKVSPFATDMPDLDFIASVNMLSQLPMLPTAWLRSKTDYAPETIEQYGKALIEAHIHYLSQFPQAVCALITDTTQHVIGVIEGKELESYSLIYDCPLPCEPLRRWQWEIAPAPEFSRKVHLQNSIAYGIVSGL